MKIAEIMTREVTVVDPEASIREACKKMRDGDIGFLPVCGGERIEGAVTDRDIVTRGIAAGLDPDTTRVKELMSPKIVYIFDDQDVLEAARLMEVKQLRRLTVLNRQKRMVGVLSLGDVSTRGRDEPLAGEVLERISQAGDQATPN